MSWQTWMDKIDAFLEELVHGDFQPTYSYTPPNSLQNTLQAPVGVVNPDTLVLWDTPAHNYHNVRVLADLAGLSVNDKNILCAVIYGESGFLNSARCENKNQHGVVTSVDVGICQINSFFHCGIGKDFTSTDYVIANPQAAVDWMIKMYQNGLIKLWCAYSNGRYKQFLGKVPV